MEQMVIGKKIVRYDVVESTNDLVQELARTGEPEGLVVSAEEQRAGRGRMGRRWVAPHGTSIQCSVLLRPDLAPVHAGRIMLLAGLAVAACLRQELALAPALKWPNDLLLNGKKVAGILIETSMRGDQLDYCILGIGLNVNFTMRDFPELAPFATTLADEVGHPVNRAHLEGALFSTLDDYYARLRSGISFLDEYRRALPMLGSRIRAAATAETFEGIARDIDDDGALLVERDGVILRLLAGDVTILKGKEEP